MRSLRCVQVGLHVASVGPSVTAWRTRICALQTQDELRHWWQIIIITCTRLAVFLSAQHPAQFTDPNNTCCSSQLLGIRQTCLNRTHSLRRMILISAPIIFCHWLCLSVRLFVTLLLQIDSSLLVSRWNRAIFGRHLSMWNSTKLCSSIFDLGPLTPKIYSPKLLAIMLHYHVATRGRTLATADLPRESRQSTELWRRPLLPWQRNLG